MQKLPLYQTTFVSTPTIDTAFISHLIKPMGILSVDIFIRFDKALKWTDFAQNEGNKKITMTDCKQNKTKHFI